MDSSILRWVNEIREQYRLGDPLEELPKGRPGCAWDCPIAVALGAGGRADSVVVGASELGFHTAEHGLVVLDVPEYVRLFIRDVDAGNRPELVEA